jgi:hypothetical protein
VSPRYEQAVDITRPTQSVRADRIATASAATCDLCGPITANPVTHAMHSGHTVTEVVTTTYLYRAGGAG